MTTLREIHDEVERCNAETKKSLAALEFMNATLKADLAEMEKKERPWWNVEATITVRMKLAVVRDPNWGADADGNRGVDRSWVEIERQEVEGDNETIEGMVDEIICDMSSIELEEIARDAGL